MPTYRSLFLHGGTTPGDPPGENCLALRPATRWSVHQQMRAQDRIVGSGRRTLLESGLNGADQWFVVNSNPDSVAVDPVYPDDDTYYTVGRAPDVPLTPGSVLRLSVVAIGSGATQYKVSDWDPDGAQGYVRLTVTYKNEDAATEAVVREISIPASPETYSAEPNGAGEAWPLIKLDAAINVPEDFDFVIANTAKWCTPEIRATIKLDYRASPRVVHACVYEEPRLLARDVSKANWPAHLYTQAFQPLNSYPPEYPLENNTATDPALGTDHVLDTAIETAEQLGPALCYWSSWAEHVDTVLTTFSSASHDGNNTNGTGDNEATPVTTTSTTFVHWLDSGVTAYDETAPGLAFGCGAYGRHFRTSGERLILRDKNGVVPCLVAVYMKISDPAQTVTVRVATNDHSYVELTHTGDTVWTWAVAPAELECGTGPEDDAVLQVLWKVTGGTGSLRYVGVYFRPDPP